jgi:enoyl-CoA hydratase/carnithine racemase
LHTPSASGEGYLDGMSEHIHVEIIDRVQRIVIDRPRKKNALTPAMYTAIADALASGEASDGVRVHYITGAGTTFTAGNDMATFLNPSAFMAPVVRFLTAIRDASKPLVIAVNGAAIGVGVTMLLHADLVYAATSARLRTPFVDLGLVPEAGSSLLMPTTMGHTRAAELLLLGETLSAQRACESLLVNEVLDDDALETHAMRQAVRLANRAPAAMRASKALMRRANATALRETMDEEYRVFAERLASPELAEAVTAFLEKRAPEFA